MKALFKVTSMLKSQKLADSQLYIKLFDTLVKPILLYGGQIWSQHLLRFFAKDDFGKFDQLPFEQLHTKLCRRALGVGKNASSIAVR